MRTFSEIYDAEHPRAIRFTEKFFWDSRDADAADQIVADAFFDLHKAMEGGLEIKNPAAWLHSTIRLRRAEYLRRNLRVKRDGQYTLMHLSSKNTSLATEDKEFEAVDTVDLFRFTWKCLTEAEQKIAEMVFMREMNQTEVAQQLGVARRTVERRVHQVRQRLRTLLLSP